MKFLTLVCVIILPGCLAGFGLPGQGKMKMIAIESCETTGTPIPFEGGLLTLPNGDKAFTGTATFLTDVTNDYTFAVKVYKWVAGRWEFLYEKEGNIFEYIRELISKAWPKLSTHTTPSFDPDIDLIPAGEYTVTEYEMDQSDIDVPAGAVTGKLQIEYRMNNAENENILCRIIDVESAS